MDQLEELKKKLQCQWCDISYSERTQAFIFDRCQHHVCATCMNSQVYGEGRCLVCGVESNYTESTYHNDLSLSLNMYESSVAKSDEVVKNLSDEIASLKQKQANAPEEKHREVLSPHHYKCDECNIKDSEENMQLCASCHGLKFNDIEDVKKRALCSTCAIKKHMRKGHHTVDFYQYLSAYNFLSHSWNIEAQSEGIKNARASLNNTVSLFNTLSLDASENFNVLTDMARRSKSTKNQLEFIEKMETFSIETKSIHIGADSELKKHTEFLQDSVTKIKEWCDARKDNCVDESETVKLEELTAHDENDSDIGSIEHIQDDAEC